MDEMTGRLKKIKALIDAGDLEGALEECGAVKKAVMFRNPDPSMPQKLDPHSISPIWFAFSAGETHPQNLPTVPEHCCHRDCARTCPITAPSTLLIVLSLEPHLARLS
jgi:hypothetical protein